MITALFLHLVVKAEYLPSDPSWSSPPREEVRQPVFVSLWNRCFSKDCGSLLGGGIVLWMLFTFVLQKSLNMFSCPKNMWHELLMCQTEIIRHNLTNPDFMMTLTVLVKNAVQGAENYKRNLHFAWCMSSALVLHRYFSVQSVQPRITGLAFALSDHFTPFFL